MDPALPLTALSKLISMGMAAHKSLKSPEGFDKADVETLKTALDSGSWLSGLWPRSKETRIGAKHLALVSRAFGAALGRYWVSPHALDQDAIRRCMEQADLQRADPGALPDNADALHLVQSLGQNPMQSPYYKALWQAFSNPLQLPTDKKRFRPLGQDPREFESHFRLAYHEHLALHGQDVQQWLLSLAREEAPEILRRIVAQDMASWGNNHVFGNTRPKDLSRHDDSIPFLALDRMYVEPRAQYKKQEGSILALLRKLLQKHRIVVATANFGHGKSLTSRRLVRDLAREWLVSDKPGPATPYPVFIECVRNMRNRDCKHDDIVRRALWNNGNAALGQRHSMEEPMFAPLQSDRTAVYVLDGLDEVSFTRNQLEDLFRNLDETMGSDQCAVIFTRPGALHDERCLPENTPIIDLQSFGEEQIEQWIQRWNQICGTVVQSERLQALGLHELAATPILLFMIALTWGEHSDSTQAVDKTKIYEDFFRHIARGKYEREKGHPTIAQASQELIKALEDRGWIERDAEPVDAMLWLMSRVAWQAHIHAYTRSDKRLRSRDVERLIEDELAIHDDEVLELTHMGLLLAMQIDPTGRQKSILFGHQSFREFLVARYWKSQLCALVHDGTSVDERARIEERLMQAQLLQDNDKAFFLLIEMLRRLDDRTRQGVRHWAQQCMERGGVHLDHRKKDLHPILRQSALAIGSSVDSEQGLHINEWALRYLLVWSLFHSQRLRIWAPRVKSPCSHLSWLELWNAVLCGADLSGADLSGADLRGADLRGADLRRANLIGAYLIGADLSGADLREVDLSHASLGDADLSGADLREVDLSDASLSGADLRGADLCGAILTGADLSHTRAARERIEQARHWEQATGLDTIIEPED